MHAFRVNRDQPSSLHLLRYLIQFGATAMKARRRLQCLRVDLRPPPTPVASGRILHHTCHWQGNIPSLTVLVAQLGFNCTIWTPTIFKFPAACYDMVVNPLSVPVGMVNIDLLLPRPNRRFAKIEVTSKIENIFNVETCILQRRLFIHYPWVSCYHGTCSHAGT
jgi:hypothetical protein